MGSANCRWKGDHRVRPWAPEWQALLFGRPRSYLDRIIRAGFDGVWLDRVDVYSYWREERWQGAAEMVDLVMRMAAWARGEKPGFLVLPQNGEELLASPIYRAAIDGIGKEDMLYGDRGNDRPNAPERVARAERNFAAARAEGLPVLAVEYARRTDNIDDARRRLDALGFVAYFGPRSLAYLGFDGKPHTEDGDTEPTVAADAPEACR
jgi:cysteinyl-tRNA synthetase